MSNPVAIHTGANWKNVNNWHWIEKDCTTWAHDRIRALLTSLPCEEISITKVTKIEGDVSVNQRKGRVKQLFDLEISFEFTQKEGNTGTGFISDFTADFENVADLNLKLTPKIEKNENVLKAIAEVIKTFKTELHEVHGKPLLLEAGATEADKELHSVSGGESANMTTASVSDVSSTKPTSQSTAQAHSQLSSQSATIVDEVNFPCPPDQLYLMLTEPSRIRSWTCSPASLPQILLPGASFTLFDGNISCKFLSLKPSESIEMEWKLRAWDRSSNVTIEIKANAQGSVLKMKQTGVPSSDAEVTKNNWHNYYWNPIKRAFGILL